MNKVKNRWTIVSIVVETPPIDNEAEAGIFGYLQTHAKHIANYAKAELSGIAEDFDLKITTTSIARENS